MERKEEQHMTDINQRAEHSGNVGSATCATCEQINAGFPPKGAILKLVVIEKVAKAQTGKKQLQLRCLL